MASTRQLSRLFSALRSNDVDRARRVAEEIAQEAEGRGHASAARQLRTALRAQGHTLVTPMAAVPETLAPVTLDTTLAEVELTAELRAALDGVVTEYRYADELAELDIARRTRLLLAGPPGCGKSLTARALGATLGLPVYVVRIDGILGALLGQTSSRLHEVFRFAERTPCVLLLDELDALGRQRGDRMDVAELDRVVVGLMQELDYSRIPGLVVGTTNFPDAVDPALARRFDLTLAFPRPERARLRSFLLKRAKRLDLPGSIEPILDGLPAEATYADAERAVLDAARHHVLARLQANDLKSRSGK